MSTISSTDKARLVAQLTIKERQLAAANAAYEEALANSEVQTYRFDSGEGSQSATRRNPQQILDQIRQLESQIDRLRNRINGTGIVNMNLRRRSYYGR